MNKFVKKYAGVLSFLGTLIFSKVIFEVLTEFGYETIFNSPELKIIAALLVGIFTHVILISSQISKSANKTTTDVEMHIKRVVDLLKIHNQYFHDDWLFKTFEEMALLMEFGKENRSALEIAKHDLRVSISNAKTTIVGTHMSNDMDEWDRITALRKAQELATSCVYAVTIDVRDYYELFWMSVNEEEYSYFNIEAARKGRMIKRIFIMEDDVLTNPNNRKYLHFKELTASLKKGGSKIELLYITMSSFKSTFSNLPDTSFFLCDGKVSSESGQKDKSNGGYFYINKPENYDSLLKRFDLLSRIAKNL